MLDKQTSNLLQNLNSLCPDGAYKVLEKAEILTALSSKFATDEDGLKSMIEHLQERNYVSVKYSDADVYCIAVLPKGRLFEEKSKELERDKRKYNKLVLTTISLASLASFVGAFIAMVVYNLIF